MKCCSIPTEIRQEGDCWAPWGGWILMFGGSALEVPPHIYAQLEGSFAHNFALHTVTANLFFRNHDWKLQGSLCFYFDRPGKWDGTDIINEVTEETCRGKTSPWVLCEAHLRELEFGHISLALSTAHRILGTGVLEHNTAPENHPTNSPESLISGARGFQCVVHLLPELG